MEDIIKDIKERFEMVVWGLAPDGTKKYSKGLEIERFISKEVEKIFKACGNCTICYGKGYSTNMEGYSESDGYRKWVEHNIYICKCGRGKQLDKLFEPK